MAVKISGLPAGTAPYVAATLVEVSVPTGGSPSHVSEKAQLSDLFGSITFDAGVNIGNTDPATAPGAGKLRIAVVAGSEAGTAKVLLYAGTSTAPLELADNIGSGF